jgi:glucose-6-phosphate isomerase
MDNISLQLDRVSGFVTESEIAACKKELEQNNVALHAKTGKGNDFLGWIDLPNEISETELADIEKSVVKLQPKHIEIYVVIGIGGSYLGSKAVIDALTDSFAQIKGSFEAPNIVFAGQNISEDYLFELRDLLDATTHRRIVIADRLIPIAGLNKRRIRVGHRREHHLAMLVAQLDANGSARDRAGNMHIARRHQL